MLSSSPKLFAANHVLRRLLPPRHSPSALGSLTNKSSLTAKAPASKKPDALATTHVDRHCVQTLWTQKDIRLSKTAGSQPATSLYRAGHPQRVLVEQKPFLAGFLSCASRRLIPLVLRIAQADSNGADRDRTDDLRLAKPALSQLSYSPVIVGNPVSVLFGSLRSKLPQGRAPSL